MTIATPLLRTTPPAVWPRRVLFAGLVLLAVIWALPMVVAHSPLVGWLEQQASARTGCTVHIGGVSLGWFSAVTAYDTELRDGAGQPLLTAGTIESQRTLLGLLLHRDNPGGFRVEKATLEVVFAGAGSNLDETIAQLIETPAAGPVRDAGPATPPPMEVAIVDSIVKLTEKTAGHTWQLTAVQATVRLFHDEAQPVQARVIAAIAAGGTAGTIEASVAVHADEGAGRHGTLKARLQNMPLEAAVPLLRRLVPDVELVGALQGQCLLSWVMDRGAITELAVDGDFTGKSCKVCWPGLAEVLVLDNARVPCKLRYDGTHVDVANAELICDLGQVRYAGAIDLSAAGLAWLDRPAQEVAGTLDLVRLADRLPKTLHVHPDLRLTSGQLRLEAKSGAQADDGWDARLNVTNITGVRGNQPIIWQEPVILDCRARQVGGGVPLIEEIRCTSGFLQLDGITTTDGFRFVGDADLGRLADPLSRFIDLGPTRLAGQAHGELTVRTLPGKRFIATGTGRLNDLFVEWIKGRPVEEDVVTVQLAAAGQVEPGGAQRVDSARLTLGLGSDLAQADLAEPLADLAGPEWGVWQVRLEGDLAHWEKRARPSAPALDRWQLGGALLAQGQVRRGSRGIECPALAVSVRDFSGGGRGLHIQEPTLYLHAAAGVDATGTLHLRDMQLRCPSLSATAPHLLWQPGTEQIRGGVKFRGDIARLQHWVHDIHAGAAEPLGGEVDGHVDLRPDATGLDFAFQLAVQEFTWGDTTMPTDRDPEVRCTGKGRFEPERDRLLLAPMHVDSPFGAVDMQAKVVNLTDTCDLALTGEVHYDLAHLETLLRTSLGIELNMAGKETRPFALSGPLYPRTRGEGLTLSMLPGRAADTPLHLCALTGEATLGWRSLRAAGCEVGPAELRFCLQQGWLQLYPVETTLNGGRLRLQPNLRLDPGPAELILLAGPVVEKARITPEVCAGALAFAMPAVGHVAEAEGTVSLTLDGGRVPLDDPARADVQGKLIFHDARFGPGPLTRELTAVFKKPPPSCVVRASEVPFHMANGRIYHRDLELIFPEFTVKTFGSVGLDGSLVLLVEMPMPPKLVASLKLSAALARQTIRLPVSGTVDEPRLDARACRRSATRSCATWPARRCRISSKGCSNRVASRSRLPGGTSKGQGPARQAGPTGAKRKTAGRAHVSAVLPGQLRWLVPFVPRRADVRQDGAAAARRHAGGVEHLHGVLRDRPAPGLRLRPLRAGSVGPAAARGLARPRPGCGGLDPADRAARYGARGLASRPVAAGRPGDGRRVAVFPRLGEHTAPAALVRTRRYHRDARSVLPLRGQQPRQLRRACQLSAAC